MASSGKLNIYYLPKWYPNINDPQLGIFIKKQAEAAALFHNICVIYAVSTDKITAPFQIKAHSEGNLHTYICYYKKKRTKIASFYAYFKAYKKVIRAVLKEHPSPDLIHEHVMLRPALIYRRYFSKIPYLISEHWSGYVTREFEQKQEWIKQRYRKFAANSKAILVVSEHLKDAMEKNSIEGNYMVVPNIIETSASKKKKIVDGKKILLTVADLEDHIKNISGIIKVIGKLKENYKFEYHIIGDGRDRLKLEELALELGLLNKSIFFLGRKTNHEVLEYIKSADAIVVNSFVETFSMVTAEAMACGKPVVATKCGGPEYLITEETGILVPPGDHEALKKGILTVLENDYLFDEEKIKAAIGDKFSRPVVGQQLSNIYLKSIS